jgi:hypothetical protein
MHLGANNSPYNLAACYEMLYKVSGSDRLLGMKRKVNIISGAENIRYFSGSGSVRIVER